METNAKLTPGTACRHLGLADNPFQHLEASAGEHRCYLWMQRDRIDLDHQKGYCLSGRFRDCPWLHISVPGGPRIAAAWTRNTADSLVAAGHRLQPAVVTMAGATAATASGALRSTYVWSRENLPSVAGYLWNGLGCLATAIRYGLEAARRNTSNRWTESRLRRQSRAAPEAPEDRYDLQTLLRLGREASLARQKKQACLFFSRATRLDPSSEEAWLWLAATTGNPTEAMTSLEKALAINPESGRARSQVTEITGPAPSVIRKSRSSSRTRSTSLKLVQRGIAALDSGNEDEAYQLFTEATESEKDNESAWFWRAKTATDLAIVISCLERVLEINPGNEKAGASLDWALERRRTSLSRTRVPKDPTSRPVVPSLYAKNDPVPKPFLLQLSSAAYLVMGLLWVAAALSPALDGQLADLYRIIGILPVLELPHVSSSLFVTSDLFPEFNLLYLAPILLSALCFVAMETVWQGKEAVSIYLATVAAVSVMAMGVLGIGRTPFLSLTIICAVAGISALGGRIDWRRRGRAFASQT